MCAGEVQSSGQRRSRTDLGCRNCAPGMLMGDTRRSTCRTPPFRARWRGDGRSSWSATTGAVYPAPSCRRPAGVLPSDAAHVRWRCVRAPPVLVHGLSCTSTYHCAHCCMLPPPRYTSVGVPEMPTICMRGNLEGDYNSTLVIIIIYYKKIHETIYANFSCIISSSFCEKSCFLYNRQ